MKKSMIHSLCPILSGLFILSFFGCAGMSVTQGMTAYRDGDYNTAAVKFLPAAESGDPEALYMMGALYQTGRGVQKDEAEANRWFQLAAEAGNADAQTFLGLKYYLGNSVDQDFGKSRNYLLQARRQGNRMAMFLLGNMYENGHGVEKNDTGAYFCYLEARILGFPVPEETLDRLKKTVR